MLLAYWVNRLSPFLIQFTDSFGIRYYSLAYMLGFLTAGWLLIRYARAGLSLVPAEKVSDLMMGLIFGVMIGGRLGYFLLYQPAVLIHQPLALFRVWDGGMASHGGFVGVALAIVWFSRSQHISFLHVSDLIASTTAAGLLFGRIANFINGELWGKVSYVSWAVIFPSAPAGPDGQIAPRHPSQLYEAALEGALLLAAMQWRIWRTPVLREKPGRVAGECLLLYAVARAICELFREPDASLILGLSRGTFYSLFIVAGGLAYVIASNRSAPLTRATEGKMQAKE